MAMMEEKLARAGRARTKDSLLRRMGRDLRRNRVIYLMALPVLLYYGVFEYGPMYGLQIAFKDYSLGDGILGSPWVGFKHFQEFFESFYFWRLIRNTLLLSLYDLLFGFPAAIGLALLLNELRVQWFKRTIQTVTYLPHFISIVVVVGMMVDFLARDGVVNQLLMLFGMPETAYMREPDWFRFLYVASGIWKEVGWGSIIYLAALAAIDPTLYEAAKVDGAGRWKQALHITIPGIMPTVIILLILKMGTMMTVGSEKILLMYTPLTFETADVISTFVYRKGILESNYSYTAAVGLFNAVIAFTLLVVSNSLSKRLTDTKLW
ncbi:binding-protein-dependent transport systems inner membrane component [Paenibacillus mucilaginosus 3016]|uniref:Binding-protein-dependent transport systems inner membrane component n=2 Tax=Paenibacillus mucilaginosus TaxID=61624 RepID=H6NB63_9BACL|nr:ABC transporter permease subunit [Paenibacillus mucilaginosus]AFC32031.1 binding-protein-dependent transport systems inner membrane component [Paenibacillus mucilaginosus 3016]AFH64401.2 sugar ABC transporter permease [Paenibacillus mucilaginosus K02]WFA20542.1 sugar ABC transporter permease [Paenibacillus mucilaginosus]